MKQLLLQIRFAESWTPPHNIGDLIMPCGLLTVKGKEDFHGETRYHTMYLP